MNENRNCNIEDSNCQCCCGPYPEIDLSPIFKSRRDGSKNISEGISQERETVQKQLKEACSQYGCFHVLIDTDALLESDKSLSVLANMNSVKDLIECLFEKEFLQSIHQSDEEDTNIKPISTIYFPDRDDDKDGGKKVLSATYRGRSAESGSNKSGVDQGEPKQSWEIFRSSSHSPMTTRTTTTTKDNLSLDSTSKLQILQQFVNNLHKVVVVLCLEALDLPKDTFVCNEEHRTPNKDLLRVFRYDTVSSSEEQLSNLGSSTHTDWGTLTVVWQDNVGGLQIYCHKRNRWNDVEPKDHDMDNDGKKIRLFVHVGDFLSLAMNSRHDERGSGGIKITNQTVQWPSPTHRVVCPVRRNGSFYDSRCSLVYFAYPPNSVSLSDAAKSLLNVDDSHDAGQTNESTNSTGKKSFPFNRYMLLNDQSVEIANLSNVDPDEISKNTFERILNQPFDQVIEQKWNQVQRS